MADDGYLIGYEDGSGNFVEVGRFNNAAEDTSQPILIEHTASGKRMELDGNGFDYQSADITNVGAFDTDSVSTTTAEIDYNGGANWDGGAVNYLGSHTDLADDAAATFYENGIREAFGMIGISQGTNTGTAVFGGNSVSPSCSILTQSGDLTVEASTVSLSGTTGTDGVVTVAITDGSIEIENRLSAECFVDLTIFGGGTEF